MAELEKTLPHLPHRVGGRECRGNFLGFMRQVRQGSSFIVTLRGEVVAVVQPPQATAPTRRQPGKLRGKIRMAPDFGTLSDDILSIMENGEL